MTCVGYIATMDPVTRDRPSETSSSAERDAALEPARGRGRTLRPTIFDVAARAGVSYATESPFPYG